MVYTVKLKKNNITWKIICDNFDIRNIIHEDMPQFGNTLMTKFATNTDKFWTIIPLDMGNCMYAKHNYNGGAPSSIFVFVMLTFVGTIWRNNIRCTKVSSFYSRRLQYR